MPSQRPAHADPDRDTRAPSRVPGRGALSPAPAGAQLVGAGPGGLDGLLHRGDAGTRERVMAGLQQSHGNAAVQRLVAGGGDLPVQRWAVNLPAGTTDCATVVNYMNTNSPHRNDGGWAKTSVRFNWGGDPSFAGSGDSLTATVRNPSVTKSMSVDMPRWAPTNPAMASAWSSMTTDLRAHEAQHEGIANRWETTLRTDLTGLTVYPASRTTPAFTSAVQSEWDGWLGQHQSDQRAIDPYSALLNCGGDEESTTPDGNGGGSAPTAPITGLDDDSDEIP